VSPIISKSDKSELYNKNWYENVYVNFETKVWHCRPFARAIRFFGIKNALDIGTASGYLVKALMNQKINVKGVDVSKELIQDSPVKENIYWVDLDDEKLPFSSEYFNLVTAFDVLEHCFRLENVLKELNRVLIVGGYLMVQIPEISMDDSPTHVTSQTKEQWIKQIENNSFEYVNLQKRLFIILWIFSFIIEVFLRFKEGKRGRQIISASYVPFQPYKSWPDHFLIFKKH
jgi:ubiquinone/menaquinone biosynthesis C-methylase UbiE